MLATVCRPAARPWVSNFHPMAVRAAAAEVVRVEFGRLGAMHPRHPSHSGFRGTDQAVRCGHGLDRPVGTHVTPCVSAEATGLRGVRH